MGSLEVDELRKGARRAPARRSPGHHPGTDRDTILDFSQTQLEAKPNNCGCDKAEVELWPCLSPAMTTPIVVVLLTIVGFVYS